MDDYPQGTVTRHTAFKHTICDGAVQLAVLSGLMHYGVAVHTTTQSTACMYVMSVCVYCMSVGMPVCLYVCYV